MLKNLKYLCFTLLMLLNCSKMSYAQNLSAKDFYFRASEVKKFPAVFSKIEKVIERLYQFPDTTKMSEFFDSEEKIYEYAKLMVQLNYLTDEQKKEYFDLANSRLVRYKEGKKGKQPFIARTIQVVNMMKDYVYKKVPWEWQFHIRNKYLLIVKAREIYRDRESKIYPYYRCDIIDDIKGNYKGERKDVLFAGNFVYEKMEPGKTYMIIVLMRSSKGDELENTYMIRGLLTDDHAIFPIENSKIIDEFGVLRTGVKINSIDDYRMSTRDFLHKIAEVPKDE